MIEPFEEDEELQPSPPDAIQRFVVEAANAGDRLDQFLTARLLDVSRARVQQLIEQQRVLVDGHAMKPSGKLHAGSTIIVTGKAALPPLRAEPEAIPLDIVYEDEFLAVVNKPAGMMVHAGSGATEETRNRGTLVNALLHHMASLSHAGDALRPGIVHRLDKQTSGLILVAKNDGTHRRLGEMFAQREVHKTYLALVHGNVKLERETLNAPISRDHLRRTRMTTRHTEGRTAVTHYRVLQRIVSRYGRFSLLEVKIETGRTHQIRVHLSSIGHPVVGDTLYGAPRTILPHLEAPASKLQKEAAAREALLLERNFLHAAGLQLIHPETGKPLDLHAPMPAGLADFLARLQSESADPPFAGPAGSALLKSKR
jgi:23S rRNA pseudouridine1911/1915/1917 synthase